MSKPHPGYTIGHAKIYPSTLPLTHSIMSAYEPARNLRGPNGLRLHTIEATNEEYHACCRYLARRRARQVGAKRGRKARRDHQD